MTPMQSIHRIFATATLAATALLSQALHAQVSPHPSQVNVPFAFNCGDQHFAPGIYMMEMSGSNVLSLSGQSQRGWLVFLSESQAAMSAQGSVVFRKYGNRYFLAEYRPANSPISARIVKSKLERRAARDFAANKEDQGRVRLALLENGSTGSSSR